MNKTEFEQVLKHFPSSQPGWRFLPRRVELEIDRFVGQTVPTGLTDTDDTGTDWLRLRLRVHVRAASLWLRQG